MSDPQEDEVWAEIEQMMTEEFPELITGFRERYKDPTYGPTNQNPGTCTRCGAQVDWNNEDVHSKWHRALSLRIHTQMALCNFIFGELENRQEKT